MNTNKVILKPLFQKKSDPLTLILKDIFRDNRNAMSYLGALSLGLGFSQTNTVFAEEDNASVSEEDQFVFIKYPVFADSPFRTYLNFSYLNFLGVGKGSIWEEYSFIFKIVSGIP